MKLTWFGGPTLRVHIGGDIIVLDPPPGAGEIVSGADRLIRSSEALPEAPADWRPRAPGRLIDTGRRGVMIHRLENALLLDAPGEPPLLVGMPPPLGRWASDAVVVLFRPPEAPPRARLIVLAMDEPGPAMEAMRPRLDGTALVALERAMGLEI